MNDEKILNKLEKLLALSGSPNEHEANAAMQKAIEIAVEHNIELSRLNSIGQKKEIPIEKDQLNLDSRLPITHKFVSDILAKYFEVNLVTGGSRNSGRILYFIGKKDKIEFAKFLHSYLNNTFFNLWYDYYKRNPFQKHARETYFLGLWQGLSKVLREAKESIESRLNETVNASYQLTVQDDKKQRESALEVYFPKLRNMAKKKITIKDEHALNEGIKQGEKINVHSGLTGTNDNVLYIT